MGAPNSDFIETEPGGDFLSADEICPNLREYKRARNLYPVRYHEIPGLLSSTAVK